jgi:hypothetical protein
VDAKDTEKKLVHKLNKDARSLLQFIKNEGDLLTSIASHQNNKFISAEKLIDYNQSLIGKADRIYELLPDRFDRRNQADLPPISPEFNDILEILANGCTTITRVNSKLRSAIIDGTEVQPEEIREEYWEKLLLSIEQWQLTHSGSYNLHALLDAAVTANEIKWASRQAKKLLYECTSSDISNKVLDE